MHATTLLRILLRERPLGDVIRPALGAENEEPIETLPLVDGPREAARRVGDLRAIGNRLACGVTMRRRRVANCFDRSCMLASV